ncbi:MAG: hypothetical protein KBA31_01190 [Alphaproteobacteria bacterium]|nr:hypothetical protein [Alphaproteobacteria bacterium]
MTRSIARLQSWMLWVAGILAALGSVGIASLPLKVLFLQVNVLMPIVGLLCLASAYAASERAALDAASPSISRRIRIYALVVLAIASFVTVLPLVSLPVVLPLFQFDMLMLLIGFGCLFFAYIGTRA